MPTQLPAVSAALVARHRSQPAWVASGVSVVQQRELLWQLAA